ncbi:hypothetical protein WJX77_000721 [Trebouxia sp. C0004]
MLVVTAFPHLIEMRCIAYNGARPPASVITKLIDSLTNGHLTKPSEALQKAYAKIDEQQKSLEQHLQKMVEDNNQTLKDVMADLAADLNDKLETAS